MKAIRTTGIIVSVALAAVALAVLPVVEEEDAPERGGIAIGEASDAGGADGRGAEAATADGGEGAVDGSGSATGGGAVALPRPSATEQPVGGVHSDTGVGALETEPSPEPAPEPTPEPAPAPAAPTQQKPSTGGSSSSGGSSSGESASSGGSGGSKPAPPSRPSGVCEWDDGELECDDDGGDDDDEDDDDDDGEDDD